MLSDVSPLGYCYYKNHSVSRIQRGKPKGRVSINCYFHPGCSFLINLARCPEDEVLKRWLFEVPSPLDGASQVDRKALTARQIALAKSRWVSKVPEVGV